MSRTSRFPRLPIPNNRWTAAYPDGRSDVAAMGLPGRASTSRLPQGLWSVSGSDAAGSFIRYYTGRVELRQAGAVLRFTRIIDNSNFTVEDDRTLSWIREGTATWDGAAGCLDIAVPL